MLNICYCYNCNEWFVKEETDACPNCESSDDVIDDFDIDEIVDILNKKDVKIGPYRDW